MRLVEKYLLCSFLKTFFVLGFGISLIIFIITLVQVYPEVSQYKPLFYKLGVYLIYSLPGYSGYIFPMLSLFGVMFSLSQASKNRELLAISASGGRLKEVLRPAVITGVGITLISLLFMNIIMPESKRLSRLIMDDITGEKNKEKIHITHGETWFRSDGSIVRIDLYDAQSSQAKDIGIYIMKKGMLIKRIEASSGLLGEDKWELRDVAIYDIDTQGMVYHETYHIKPSKYSMRLIKAGTLPEEMDSSRLWRYLRALKKSGLRNIKLIADFSLRWSLPLTCLSMVLIGIYLGVSKWISGLAGAGIGVGISILFWFGTTFMMSLGYAEVLNLWIATWITPVLAFVVGVFLYRRIK